MSVALPPFNRLAFVASDRPEAIEARTRLAFRYGDPPPEEADVIVALGGDGFMLETLHAFMDVEKPIFGMNRGTVGFLMNDYGENLLVERINEARATVIHPLAMTALTLDGRLERALAINEISMLRETHQTAKLQIAVDGKIRMPELFCDGALDRLQPLRPRPDYSARRQCAGPDADQRLPAPALARGAAAAHGRGGVRGAGAGEAAGQRRRRQSRGARRAARRGARGARRRPRHAVRRGPHLRGARADRAVLGLRRAQGDARVRGS
jgi:hypothetical protein